MNGLPSIDQKILTSSPFISSMRVYFNCFLTKTQGLCENAFETIIRIQLLVKTEQDSNFMHHFPLTPIILKGLYGILKSIRIKK